MLAAQYIDNMYKIKAEVWTKDDCMGITGTYFSPEL
jgi:hypothetical protein